MDNQSKESTNSKPNMQDIKPIEMIHPVRSSETPEPSESPESLESPEAPETSHSEIESIDISESITSDSASTSESLNTPGSSSTTLESSTNEIDASSVISSHITDSSTSSKPKKKKGPIIAAACFIIALLGGCGFVAAYFVANQPANIISSAFGNLISAKQVALDGSIDLAISGAESIGVDSIKLDFDSQSATSGNTTTANLQVNFANGSQPASFTIGEAMLENGVLYLQTEGLKDFYDDNAYTQLKESLVSNIESQYQYQLVENCRISTTDTSETINCSDFYRAEPTPEVTASAETLADQVLNQVGQVIDSVDGQWLEVSIDDVLNSEMIPQLDSYTRKNITDTYNCTIDKINHLSNYSGELSDIYTKNPFINMEPAQNSFYNISFDANNIAGYVNALPQTKLAGDLAKCFNTEISDTTPNVTAEDVKPSLDYLPQISAKFDGIFDHHLSELKLSQKNEQYNLTSDLKFTYPSSVNISAPSDAHPVMDVVEEVYQQIQAITTLYTL